MVNYYKELIMCYWYKEIDLDVDDTPYDDGLTDAYVAEYEASIESDSSSTEVPEFSDDALFASLRELED